MSTVTIHEATGELNEYLLGMFVSVTPVGRGVVENVTAPLQPPMDVSVRVNCVAPTKVPGCNDNVCGTALNEKSGCVVVEVVVEAVVMFVVAYAVCV